MIHGRVSRVPLFWRFQIVGWLIFGVFTLPLKVGAFGSLHSALMIFLLREPLGFLLTSCFRLVYRRIDFRSHSPALLVTGVLGCSFLASAIDVIACQNLTFLMPSDTSGHNTVGIYCFRAMLYAVWSFLYFWIRDHLRTSKRLLNLARAESAARNAELLMLRSQVSPHFLFNALNTILAGLDRQPAALAPTVQGLADYFRYSLASRHDTLVTLGEEFDAIMNYLTVEKARFRESLMIESHLDPAARGVLVPGVFIQPLVENAIKHGYQTSPTPLRIRIRVEARGDGEVSLEVGNSGTWVDPLPSDGSHGHGLAILERRLELLYGGRQSLEIGPSPARDEVIVRVHLPVIEPPHIHG